MGDAAPAAIRIETEADRRQEGELNGGEGGGAAYTRLGWRSVRALRVVVVVTLVVHVGVSALAMVVAVVSSSGGCPRSMAVAAALVASGACVRIAWVLGTGVCQAATAVTMIAEEHVPASRITSSPAEAPPDQPSQLPRVHAQTKATRIERRLWYKRWLWWGRFGALVTFYQVAGACYVTFLAATNAHSSFCFPGSEVSNLLQDALVFLPVTTWVLVFVQCCVGSDVLSWRSLYEMQNEAWRAHYREMFDHGIRELLCCLGRSRYMTSMDEDEVDSVAALLGDLVAYRAAGASHLEFLAGVALLRSRRPKSPVPVDFPPAPVPLIREAAILHPYAVAAYTGPLLDIGRNPLFFPCAWMYRQGLLTLWNRHRMPQLDGDNWWRGHATAFLRAARVPPEALLKGRVHQKNRETVYFVIELKNLKCVVVAVRGTETPEDLLTDGLGRECILSNSDIHGLLMSKHLSKTTKHEMASSMPHYGHAGVVLAARELAFELDNAEDNREDCSRDGGKQELGFLTSILGPGGRCEGFTLRFVGHSLGGSIAAIAGMMLWHRFPTLHVYGYGVLPCVDAVVAAACSSFVTSIVYNDEFSSRLSVASLMRLRAAALRALATDSDTDSAIIARLARRLIGLRRHRNTNEATTNGHQRKDSNNEVYGIQRRRRLENKLKGGACLCYHACHCVTDMSEDSSHTNLTVLGTPVGGQVELETTSHNNTNKDNEERSYSSLDFRIEAEVVEDGSDTNVVFSSAGTGKNSEEAVGLMSREDENNEFIRGIVNGELLSNGMPNDVNNELVGFEPGSDLEHIWPVELVMPGLVIHLLRVDDRKNDVGRRRRFWRFTRRKGSGAARKEHKAVVKDRDSFRDIVVSPSMFLDHMPWRCQRALNDALEQLLVGEHERL